MPRPLTSLLIISLIISVFAPSGLAWAGANPDVHLALDMMVRAKSQSCETLAGRYLSCDSISAPLVRAALPAMRSGGALVHVIPDLVAVQFRPETPESIRAARLQDLDLRIAHRHYRPATYTVRVPQEAGVFSILRQLNTMPEVNYAVPAESGADIEWTGFSVPDPYFDKQWPLENLQLRRLRRHELRGGRRHPAGRGERFLRV